MDILYVIAALLISIVAFQLYTHFKRQEDIKKTCGFCGIHSMIDSFMGDHKNIYLGLEADAQICSACGSVRINNPAFLENLVLMCDDNYLFQVFLNLLRDEYDEYASNMGPAMFKLESIVNDLSTTHSKQLQHEFVEARRIRALSSRSDDLPFECFIELCKKDIRDLIEELEDELDIDNAKKCPYKLEPAEKE